MYMPAGRTAPTPYKCMCQRVAPPRLLVQALHRCRRVKVHNVAHVALVYAHAWGVQEARAGWGKEEEGGSEGVSGAEEGTRAGGACVCSGHLLTSQRGASHARTCRGSSQRRRLQQHVKGGPGWSQRAAHQKPRWPPRSRKSPRTIPAGSAALVGQWKDQSGPDASASQPALPAVPAIPAPKERGSRRDPPPGCAAQCAAALTTAALLAPVRASMTEQRAQPPLPRTRERWPASLPA